MPKSRKKHKAKKKQPSQKETSPVGNAAVTVATRPAEIVSVKRVMANGGRDIADELQEADPDGRPVKHTKIYGRMIDRLWLDGKLRTGPTEKLDGRDLYDAGTELRDLYEHAGPCMGMRIGFGGIGGSGEIVADPEAWGRYIAALRAIHPFHTIVRAVVVEDRAPEEHKRDEFKRLVNGLTNHERNLWARADYPGLRPSHNADKLRQWMEDHEIHARLQPVRPMSRDALLVGLDRLARHLQIK